MRTSSVQCVPSPVQCVPPPVCTSSSPVRTSSSAYLLQSSAYLLQCVPPSVQYVPPPVQCVPPPVRTFSSPRVHAWSCPQPQEPRVLDARHDARFLVAAEPDPCASAPCQNGGVCRSTGTPRCVCPRFVSGDNCEISEWTFRSRGQRRRRHVNAIQVTWLTARSGSGPSRHVILCVLATSLRSHVNDADVT